MDYGIWLSVNGCLWMAVCDTGMCAIVCTALHLEDIGNGKIGK